MATAVPPFQPPQRGSPRGALPQFTPRPPHQNISSLGTGNLPRAETHRRPSPACPQEAPVCWKKEGQRVRRHQIAEVYTTVTFILCLIRQWRREPGWHAGAVSCLAPAGDKLGFALCTESQRNRCLGTGSSLAPLSHSPQRARAPPPPLAAGRSKLSSSSSCGWNPHSHFFPN